MPRRLFPLLRMLGPIITCFGLSMLLPIGVSWLLEDTADRAYDYALLLSVATGLLLWLYARGSREELKAREGFLLVVLSWVLLPLFACIPLLIQIPDLSFTQAYFEAMSGLTATGATMLSGLDTLPPSINLWRAQLNWMGGLGVIVMVVAILPVLGVGGRQMFKAETPGPMKDTKLTPRLASTAKGLGLVYLFFTSLCALALWAGGMGWLDALIHAFSTLGLGGFSSHDSSLGYYDSPLLEGIVMVFALIAAIGFSTHFLALRTLNPMHYLRDFEIGWMLSIVLGSCLGIAVFLWWQDYYLDFPSALRHAAFNTVSVATTLGYSTADYNHWPFFAPLWMLFLATFSSCSGSPGGGIKMMRAQLLFAQLYREIVKLLHPNAQYPTKLGNMVVPNKIIYAVLAFLFIYVASSVILTFVLTFSGLDVLTAFSAVVATLNNAGPGLGEVGPAHNYAVLSDFQAWVCIFSMLLGRLELFTLLVVLTPAFWRK